MSSIIYCVRFENKIKPYYGYIKPWNAVRDDETYSLTYLPPSFLDGIKDELGLKGDIVRHKLLFDKYSRIESDMTKCIVYKNDSPIKKKKKKNDSSSNDDKKACTIHRRHTLVNPILILGFENKEDAEYVFGQPLYFGQTIYPIYCDFDFGIKEFSIDEFNNLNGVETFKKTKEEYYADENCEILYVGNNRQRNNERMYIHIDRKEW